VEILPQETVLHRMTGDGPGSLLIAPDWVRNKKKVLNTLNAMIGCL
jgi:radical SAM superfamily enzyme